VRNEAERTYWCVSIVSQLSAQNVPSVWAEINKNTLSELYLLACLGSIRDGRFHLSVYSCNFISDCSDANRCHTGEAPWLVSPLHHLLASVAPL
jgi:hypothetical protein